MIKENLEAVRADIENSAKKSGRNASDITLIAVSKTQPIEKLIEAYNDGAREFGENKVQEIVAKYPLMPCDAHFHMIGHLQKNKVKDVVDKAVLIHSVDSLELANVIQKESQKRNIVSKILIEVNIAREESKFGVFKEDVLTLAKEISKLSNVSLNGLMTVAPYVDNAEDNRQYFASMKQLAIDIENQNIDNVSMKILSMGMSADYTVAIEEGATHVRVGTKIFGARNYSK